MISLLAQAELTTDDKIRALRFGFTMIVIIGIVGVLLIVALIGAWRNFHKRLRQLEADRDEARQAMMPDDAWQAAGQRVEVEPAPGSPGRSRGDEEDEDDNPDLYGKDWEPGDDDENPDDDERW